MPDARRDDRERPRAEAGRPTFRVPAPPGPLRTDVRRALALLHDGWWVRAHLPDRGRPWAAVQLSKYRDDLIPVGVDVLGLLRAAGWVAERRRLPGGHRRFDLTPAGGAAVGAADAARAPGATPDGGHAA